MSRTSPPGIPESPASPPDWTKRSRISAAESCTRSIRYSAANESSSPWRVAFSKPDCGEKPIVVSTERPPRIAHIEELPPKWHDTARRLAPSAPSNPGSRSATDRCEAP